MVGDICVVGIAYWKTYQNAKHFITLLAKCLMVLHTVELNVAAKVLWRKFKYLLLEISMNPRNFQDPTLVTQIKVSLLRPKMKLHLVKQYLPLLSQNLVAIQLRRRKYKIQSQNQWIQCIFWGRYFGN